MPLITLNNLNPYTLSAYNYRGWQRANQLRLDGKVTLEEFTGSEAHCIVEDKGARYPVLLSARTKTQLSAECDCPNSSPYNLCVHALAAMLEVTDYLQTGGDQHWKYRLQLASDYAPPLKAARSPSVILVLGLTVTDRGYANPAVRISIHQVRRSAWPAAQQLAGMDDPAGWTALLEKDTAWQRSTREVYSPVSSAQVLNLAPEGVHLVNMLQRYSSYYYSMPDFADLLPALARQYVPMFRISQQEKWGGPVRIRETPLQIELLIEEEQGQVTVSAALDYGGEIPTSKKQSRVTIISEDPAWALVGDQLRPVDNPRALDLLSYFPMHIPAPDVEEFRQRYLLSLASRAPIRGDLVTYRDVEGEPAPRLYLSDAEGKLRAALRFAYGELETPADPKAPEVSLQVGAGSWEITRVQRDLAREEGLIALLTGARFGLKRATQPAPPGAYELRARTHPLDFLTRSIPALTQAGFEIFGEEKLKVGRINRASPTLTLHISSGIDWFDIQAVARFGDQEVPFKVLRGALKKQERYIKLADGSIGQIPEEWLTRYKKLFALAEETENGLRVSDAQLPAVDILLEDADQTQAAADFAARRERLRTLADIQPQPVPTGFQGELRPYQRAGLDWLRSLYDNGFGGCLADDMGLGKTVQVLALLLSLKEAGKLDRPALLVAPKSLLVNWQREAERFTPDLRVMIYSGPGRKKEAVDFSAADLVLTTYGILLRDIESLRSGPFAYAILDESQNIKNPLSQSAKAARLLNAPHRLVLTGTPVENNTFELWSQFAFLNPGLLGSQDSFKREFASPIESGSDPQAAPLLRRLIHPFLLRRTKQQVAPELPPRTERMVLVDFEPAQRRLYQQTRDYYRSSLLGLIEESGMEDARMKILEGLLRLRQISIHPALVDPNYTGDAPKFQALLDTLETLRAEGHKALIFSQFVHTLRLLEGELTAREMRYTYLDGSTENRQERVDQFQNDPSIPFFLISLKAGGVGLNLTAADYVIHIDPWWNPAVEMQAADRAHRIGQDKPVFIYKLITRGSVEEKIVQLQERKRALVEQLISAESSFFKSITKEDVQALFS